MHTYSANEEEYTWEGRERRTQSSKTLSPRWTVFSWE